MHNSERVDQVGVQTSRQSGFRIRRPVCWRTEDCWGRCRDETPRALRRHAHPCFRAVARRTPSPATRRRSSSATSASSAAAHRGSEQRRPRSKALSQFLYPGSGDVPIGSPLEIGVKDSEIFHDRLALLEARHPFLGAALGHRLFEILHAERLEALDERRADQTLLIGAVTAIACARPPSAKAVHYVRIDLITVHYLVRLVLDLWGLAVLRRGVERQDRAGQEHTRQLLQRDTDKHHFCLRNRQEVLTLGPGS